MKLYLVYRITIAQPPRLMMICTSEQEARSCVARQSSPASHILRDEEAGREMSY